MKAISTIVAVALLNVFLLTQQVDGSIFNVKPLTATQIQTIKERLSSKRLENHGVSKIHHQNKIARKSKAKPEKEPIVIHVHEKTDAEAKEIEKAHQHALVHKTKTHVDENNYVLVHEPAKKEKDTKEVVKVSDNHKKKDKVIEKVKNHKSKDTKNVLKIEHKKEVSKKLDDSKKHTKTKESKKHETHHKTKDNEKHFKDETHHKDKNREKHEKHLTQHKAKDSEHKKHDKQHNTKDHEKKHEHSKKDTPKHAKSHKSKDTKKHDHEKKVVKYDDIKQKTQHEKKTIILPNKKTTEKKKPIHIRVNKKSVEKERKPTAIHGDTYHIEPKVVKQNYGGPVKHIPSLLSVRSSTGHIDGSKLFTLTATGVGVLAAIVGVIAAIVSARRQNDISEAELQMSELPASIEESAAGDIDHVQLTEKADDTEGSDSEEGSFTNDDITGQV